MNADASGWRKAARGAAAIAAATGIGTVAFAAMLWRKYAGETGVPGFEAAFAIAGVCAVILAVVGLIIFARGVVSAAARKWAVAALGSFACAPPLAIADAFAPEFNAVLGPLRLIAESLGGAFTLAAFVAALRGGDSRGLRAFLIALIAVMLGLPIIEFTMGHAAMAFLDAGNLAMMAAAWGGAWLVYRRLKSMGNFLADAHDVLLIFLKWPEPGTAKTRLIPALGAEGAADLYRRMVARVMRQLALAPASLRQIAFFTPAERENQVRAWLAEYGLEFVPQPPGDLTPKLIGGFDWGFASGARRVIAIGTDCVDISAAVIGEASAALDACDAVIGPAHDGGYYLIGLRRPLPAIFEGVPWSAPNTLAVTRERLREVGASVAELPMLADIDTPADLAAVWPDWQQESP